MNLGQSDVLFIKSYSFVTFLQVWDYFRIKMKNIFSAMPSHSPRSVSTQFPLPLPHMITSSWNASKPTLDLLSQTFHGMEPRELCFKMVLTLKFDKHWFRLVRTHAWSWVGVALTPFRLVDMEEKWTVPWDLPLNSGRFFLYKSYENPISFSFHILPYIIRYSHSSLHLEASHSTF